MDNAYLKKENDMSRREFMKGTMWTALLAWASFNSFGLIAAPGRALAADAAAPLVPKELVFNANWWKALYAWMMAITEIPILEDSLATTKEKGGDIEYFFSKIRAMGEELGWGTKIIPIQKSIHPEVKILPIHSFEEILRRTRVAKVGQCWCRTTFKNCDRPTNTCVLLSFADHLPELIERDEHMAAISIDEIRELIQRAEDAGLIHELIRCGDENTYYVICNCCPCCCAGLRGLVEFGGSDMILKADFISEISDDCTGCGDCMARCYFSGRSIVDGKCVVDKSRCVGCGQCATACKKNGTYLVARPGVDSSV